MFITYAYYSTSKLLTARYTRWDKRRFTVVCIENETINNTRINSVLSILTTVSQLFPSSINCKYVNSRTRQVARAVNPTLVILLSPTHSFLIYFYEALT